MDAVWNDQLHFRSITKAIQSIQAKKGHGQFILHVNSQNNCYYPDTALMLHAKCVALGAGV